MANWLTYLFAFVVAAHGLVHLLGTAAYLQLAEVAGIAYKTTLLDGRVDVGATGIQVFGVLWAVAAVGFLGSAAAMLTEWDHWERVLAALAVFSLVLTALDYTVAFAGVAVNVAILVGIVVLPQV